MKVFRIVLISQLRRALKVTTAGMILKWIFGPLAELKDPFHTNTRLAPQPIPIERGSWR
ncbi:hypothetical protein [Larkinella terrae]|uniref:Uncharacterized protein n=1 Tax=Larkinella terrae TaxID=2025311 RepID=A0A7K0EJM2_9BACT|nr:hypothetical protein [Larkinella terrae]MRS61666.1 hypothetical protein [Larkinella terrae]